LWERPRSFTWQCSLLLMLVWFINCKEQLQLCLLALFCLLERKIAWRLEAFDGSARITTLIRSNNLTFNNTANGYMNMIIYSFQLCIHNYQYCRPLTVVCSVTWPQWRLHCFRCVNHVDIVLTSWHLNEKSREVCIKARSPPAPLTIIGQITKHTTAKWPINFFCLHHLLHRTIAFWRTKYGNKLQPFRRKVETLYWTSVIHPSYKNSSIRCARFRATLNSGLGEKRE